MTVQWARDTSGDMVLPTIGNGASAIERDPVVCATIKLSSVLKFFKGEWRLNTAEGFPWFDFLGKKSPNLTSLRVQLQKAILGTPPVVAIEDFRLPFNRQLRDANYLARVRIATGQVVTVPA